MKIADSGAQSALLWIAAEAQLPPENARKLADWDKAAAHAYPRNTLKAWASDWRLYKEWCAAHGLSTLPSDPQTIALYIRECVGQAKKPATTKRYLATISRAHQAAGLLNPCSSEIVKLALKAISREQSVRQRQARALNWEHIKKFIDTAGEGIRADRERALLSTAYDTMARRSELVALDVEHLEFLEDGTGRVLIKKSKTDQEGEGAVAYLARETVRHLQTWLSVADVKEGAIFRRLIGRRRVGERLSPDQIADIYKRVGRWIRMTAEEVEGVSGHSIRVGATQDLLALNIDLGSVMQAGRWKTTTMPMRYGEHQLAGKGAMARAAASQGRDAQQRD
jgi:site-specific recombinase XerD